MNITYLAAGAGGSHCGACARDAGLVNGLRAAGHDAVLIPLYTPVRVDGADPSLERVFYGGISTYLQQKCALFRKTPRWMDWLFDRPALLRRVSRFAIETRPEGLGSMTVSVLRGEHGFQRKELEQLLDFLAEQGKPDVVNLTNSLLSGLAKPIQERLGAPVVCTLQGEDSFVRRLGSPHSEEAQALMREHAQAMDALIAPSEPYADAMADFLAIDRARIQVVRPGVDAAAYAAAAPRARGRFRVGCLSRITPAKGQDILAEAFCLLDNPGECELALAGELAPSNRRFMAGIEQRLSEAGLEDCFTYQGELDLAEKVRFLQGCHVFVLASRYPEARGIAVLEAMAAGAPAIVPDGGAFPEMLQLTNGLMLVPGEDPKALAEAIDSLRRDPARAAAMGQSAAEGVRAHFSIGRMVDETVGVYEEVAAGL